MTATEIELPPDCPLCGKSLTENLPPSKDGKKTTGQLAAVIMDDHSVVDCHCWHLRQIEIIRGLNELPSSLLQLRAWWHRVREYGQYLTLHYWTTERRRLRQVAQHHSGETPAVASVCEGATPERGGG